MAMIGLGAVMLKLKIAKAKGGMFQFIPPKLDLRYWGLKERMVRNNLQHRT